jgi:hypothetical protein
VAKRLADAEASAQAVIAIVSREDVLASLQQDKLFNIQMLQSKHGVRTRGQWCRLQRWKQPQHRWLILARNSWL